ncbi:MAG: isoprenylcysteine carboxylmethyltransferase family protein [Ardenticatenales bacterium]|nr:isoprenylcysteine carboxylmethyltransferase family protein [Ardenticatenales bacterium]
MATDPASTSAPTPRSIAGRAALYYVAALLLLGGMFFLPAGTLDYWQAWLYLAILFGLMTVLGAYLIRYEPAVLERRLRTRETEMAQQRIIRFSLVLFLVAFLIPGLDRRYGWSAVPPAVVVAADVVIVAGYLLFARVLLANRFASRVIEVAPEQTLATTGPYAVVRHPMYVAMLAIWLASPIALGSWWSFLPMLGILPVIVLRIRNEEAVLARDLAGYRAYMAGVRYRLLPGVW